MPPEKVIWFIIGTIVVLFGAYFVTYYVGMKASGQTRAGLRNRNIAVLDRYSVARDKSFYVVEIAGKVYIIGVTGNAMTVLDTYDADEYAELTEQSSGAPAISWSDTPVGRYGNKLTRSVVRFFAKKTGKLPEDKEETGSSFAGSMENARKNADNLSGEDSGAESEDRTADDQRDTEGRV